MTKEEAIAAPMEIVNRKGVDPEADHADADSILVKYINCVEIEKAYNNILKWYA